MKLSCKVIEDMLPMYYDSICSEESTTLIEEHLKDCPHCNHILLKLRSDMAIPKKAMDDIKPLKKIQKSYKKMRIHWLVAIFAIMLLIPIAFLVGNEHGTKNEHPVEFSKEEAIAYANSFMTNLVEKNYAKAYACWDIEEEKRDLLSGNLFVEEDLEDFEADGLKKFCDGGEKLESWGGITDFQFIEISDASYSNRYGTEHYLLSYIISFDEKEERFYVNLSKNGIDSISSGDSLIRHPLSHLTLWVQWVVDDYKDRYYDFDLGEWIDLGKAG